MSEKKVANKVITLCRKHGAKRITVKLKQLEEELRYDELTDHIIKSVCSAFQVNRTNTMSKKRGLRRSAEESEAFTYVIYFLNKYKHNNISNTFKELLLSQSDIRMYHSNQKQYGIVVLDEKIPRHKQIRDRLIIAESIIGQYLQNIQPPDKRGVKIQDEL